MIRPFAPLTLLLSFSLTFTSTLTPTPARAAQADTRRLSFLQAIDLALDGSHQVKLASTGIEASEAALRGARAQRYPRLRAEANVFLWNEELTFELMGIPLPPGTSPVLRERITSTATASVIQPLTGLIFLNALVGVQEAGLQAARADLDRARLDAGYQAAEAYLRLLQALALRDVAKKTTEQFDAQMKRARALEAGGVLGKVDLLRLQSAADSAQQGLLRAEASAATAERGLALALGLPDGGASHLEVFDDLPAAPPQVSTGEEQAVALALKARPELKAAQARVGQAQKGRTAATSGYYPNVAAVGTLQHAEGQGTLTPENSWFVGLTLQWDLWEWGRTRAGVDEATARTRQAKQAVLATADGVAFEVRRRHVDARAAYATLDVAKSGLAAAEEAHRIQSVRFEQGAATTTDVLDAETDVARARSQQVVARYEYFVSLVALARAVGERPWAVK